MKHLSEEQLQAYLDGAVERRTDLETHLQSCPKCSTALAAYSRLFAELSQPPAISLSPNFATEVAKNAQVASQQGSQVAEWIIFGLSAAAGLAVTVYLLFTSLSAESLAAISLALKSIFAFAGESRLITSSKLPLFLFSIAVLALVSLMDKLLLQRKWKQGV